MFGKLADTIMKHSKAIIALWIVILVCSLPLGLKYGSVMEYDLTAMVGNDSESGKGSEIMDDYFDNTVEMEEIVVVCYDNADPKLNAANSVQLLGKFSEKLAARYDGKVTATVVGSYSGEGHTTGVILAALDTADKDISLLNETGHFRSLLSDAKAETGLGYETYVTGNSALTYDTMASSEDDVAKVDPISIFLILILLGLFFYALSTAAVPPLGVGVAYGTSLLAMYVIGSFMGVYYLTQTLVLVTMLGAGCDYGIFIVTRYREELKKGAEHDAALRSAIEWAGESVFTSGLAVIIGFGALAICNFTMVRSMGIVLACGIVLALVVALTLIPSVINILKGKIFWPTKVDTYRGIEQGTQKGFYAKLCYISKRYFDFVARFTRRFAVPIVVAALVICVPTFYVYATTDNSFDMISIEPESESKDGLNAIMNETYGGTLMPTYVVMELSSPAVATMGSVSLGTSSVPYMIWTPEALTIAEDGSSLGYVPSLMVLSQKVASDHEEIVASSSGPNSWYVLYRTAYQQIIDAKLPDLTAAAKQYLVDHGVPDPTEAQIAAALETIIPTVITPSVINHALYDRLGETSTAVQAGVGAVLDTYSMVLKGDTSWNVTPRDEISGLQLMNVIDFIINIKTGLINVDPSDEAALNGTATYVLAGSHSTTGRYASVMMITNEKPMSDNTMSLIDKLHDEFHGNGGYDEKMKAVYKESYVTGKSASMDDISETVTAEFKVIEVVVVILLIILLFLILKCYITPIRAILNILMSVIWTIALTHFVFGTLLDIPVCWIVPIVLFVVLLGLGMDYDIFLTTRVREYKLKGYTNHEAVEMAVRNAGSTITLCALIMGGTFLSLLVANSSMLKEFGFALGVGILIDGLFMVTYVVPAIMHILGESSWKGPTFMQKKIKIGRGFSGAQGLLAVAVMAVFAIAAAVLTEASFGDIDMIMMLEHSRTTEVFTQIAFGIGGALLVLFGLLMIWTNHNVYVMVTGALYVSAAVLMILASFCIFENMSQDYMWINAFVDAMVGSAIYMAYAASHKHGLTAGALLVVIIGIGGAALAGSMTLSFGLMIASVAAIFVTGLGEAAGIE